MEQSEEFKEIAHCGGQLIVRAVSDNEEKCSYQLRWQHSRPVAAGIFAIYALMPHGIPISQARLGGVGSPNPHPPMPGCLLIFIGSDSEGLFGRHCPACDGYWRNQLGTVCPYCGTRSEVHNLLTVAQQSYLNQVCSRMAEVIGAKDGEYVIDMDAVADAVGEHVKKPPFYYSEQRQQNKFLCKACGHVTDILGTYGYCSGCKTRNDFQELSDRIVPAIRTRINSGGQLEDCVRDAVAAFDSFVGRYVEQLLSLVRISPARRERLSRMRFHNLKMTANELKQVFDIDILDGIPEPDYDFITLMFHRRHVYEHRGGEADEKYIEESGDKSVRPKQALRETVESAHRIARMILKMSANLHKGFHELVPIEEAIVAHHQELLKRQKMARS